MGNALKFTVANGFIITKFSSSQNCTKVSIYNIGKAIPEEDLDLIFDKFYQSKNQNIRKLSGSGLGLKISKKIIEAHNGNIIAADSKSGVTFKIMFLGNNNKEKQKSKTWSNKGDHYRR